MPAAVVSLPATLVHGSQAAPSHGGPPPRQHWKALIRNVNDIVISNGMMHHNSQGQVHVSSSGYVFLLNM